jgi:hypothetical protein
MDEDLEIDTDDHSEWIYQEGERKLAIENEDGLEEVKFIAKSDKKAVSDEESNMSMIRAYQNNHIKHIPMFRFIDSNEKQEFDEYPLICDEPCSICKDSFDTLPIYPVIDYDYKLNCFVTSPFPTCGALCTTISIVTEGGSQMGKRLQLQGRMNREYFGLPGSVPFIPLNARKKFSKLGHLDDEGWAKAAGRVSAVIKQPPFLVVETWLEESDIDRKSNSRNKQVVANHMIKATAEQQENYLLNGERVKREFSSKRESIENTKIGKRLGVIVKKN